MAEEKDETVQGGVYIVNGQVVDANGTPRPGWTIDETGAAVPPAKKSKKQDAESAQAPSVPATGTGG